jgi:DNA-binding MarR family transcriptional regulator
MQRLILRNLPRYECLLAASESCKEMDPSALEAYLHLLRAGDAAAGAFECFVAKHGISSGRFTVLMLLWHSKSCTEKCAGGVTPASLADMAGCTRATMTGLVDTLERDGYVKRTEDARDRRSMEVSMTGKGSTALRKILPGYFTRVGELMSVLSVVERKTLVRLHKKIAEHAEQLAVAAGVNGRRPA